MRTPKHCDKHERHETWCTTCTAWDADALDDENDDLRRRIADLDHENERLRAELKTKEQDAPMNNNKQEALDALLTIMNLAKNTTVPLIFNEYLDRVKRFIKTADHPVVPGKNGTWYDVACEHSRSVVDKNFEISELKSQLEAERAAHVETRTKLEAAEGTIAHLQAQVGFKIGDSPLDEPLKILKSCQQDQG